MNMASHMPTVKPKVLTKRHRTPVLARVSQDIGLEVSRAERCGILDAVPTRIVEHSIQEGIGIVHHRSYPILSIQALCPLSESIIPPSDHGDVWASHCRGLEKIGRCLVQGRQVDEEEVSVPCVQERSDRRGKDFVEDGTVEDLEGRDGVLRAVVDVVYANPDGYQSLEWVGASFFLQRSVAVGEELLCLVHERDGIGVVERCAREPD